MASPRRWKDCRRCYDSIAMAISSSCSNITSFFRVKRKRGRKAGMDRDTIDSDIANAKAKEKVESALGPVISHTPNPNHTHTRTRAHAINNDFETLTRHDISHSENDNGNGNGNGNGDGNDNHNCNNNDIHAETGTPQTANADASKHENEEQRVAKKRRVTFKDRSFEEIILIPHLTEYNNYQDGDVTNQSPDATTSIKHDLFYSDADYVRFRANEQRRYDKMVTKKLQQMVQEKMQPKINEAVANGATLEDIEAMVPKTQAEMVECLGGQENIHAAIQASSFGGQLSQKAKDSNHKRSVGNKDEKSENTPDTEIESPGTLSSKQTIRLAKDSNHIRSIDKTHGGTEKTVDTANESPGTSNRKRTIRSSRSSIELPKAKHIYGTGDLDTTSNHSSGGSGGGRMSVLEKAVAAREASVERKRARGDYNIVEANGNTNNENHTDNDESTMSVLEAVEAAREASLELIAQDEQEDAKEFH